MVAQNGQDSVGCFVLQQQRQLEAFNRRKMKKFGKIRKNPEKFGRIRKRRRSRPGKNEEIEQKISILYLFFTFIITFSYWDSRLFYLSCLSRVPCAQDRRRMSAAPSIPPRPVLLPKTIPANTKCTHRFILSFFVCRNKTYGRLKTAMTLSTCLDVLNGIDFGDICQVTYAWLDRIERDSVEVVVETVSRFLDKQVTWHVTEKHRPVQWGKGRLLILEWGIESAPCIGWEFGPVLFSAVECQRWEKTTTKRRNYETKNDAFSKISSKWEKEWKSLTSKKR